MDDAPKDKRVQCDVHNGVTLACLVSAIGMKYGCFRDQKDALEMFQVELELACTSSHVDANCFESGAMTCSRAQIISHCRPSVTAPYFNGQVGIQGNPCMHDAQGQLEIDFASVRRSNASPRAALVKSSPQFLLAWRDVQIFTVFFHAGRVSTKAGNNFHLVLGCSSDGGRARLVDYMTKTYGGIATQLGRQMPDLLRFDASTDVQLTHAQEYWLNLVAPFDAPPLAARALTKLLYAYIVERYNEEENMIMDGELSLAKNSKRQITYHFMNSVTSLAPFPSASTDDTPMASCDAALLGTSAAQAGLPAAATATAHVGASTAQPEPVVNVSTSNRAWYNRLLEGFDALRFATADPAFDELAACRRQLTAVVSEWPEGAGKWAAILVLVRLLATADEAWTTTSSVDDDGSNVECGYRHVLMAPVVSDQPSEIRTLLINLANGEAARDEFQAFVTKRVQLEQGSNKVAPPKALQQRKGRFDAKANVSGAKGFSNKKWLSCIFALEESTGVELGKCTTLQRALELLSDGSFTCTTIRAVHVLRELPFYLPQLRNVGELHIESDSIKLLAKLIGDEAAVARFRVIIRTSALVVVDVLVAYLPPRVIGVLREQCDEHVFLFAHEALPCEIGKRVLKWAYAQRDAPNRTQICGSSKALVPTKSKKRRRRLGWWDGTAETLQDTSNVQTGSFDVKQVQFHSEDAEAVNGCMRKLVADLITLFQIAQRPVLNLFTLSNKKVNAEACKLSGSDAGMFANLLAHGHLIVLLDVWRRNTQVFLR